MPDDQTPEPPQYLTAAQVEDMRKVWQAEWETIHVRGYATLLRHLEEADDRAHKRGANDGGREAALYALAAAFAFLHGFQSIERRSLHIPLHNLWTALNDLHTNGVQHPMFAVARARNDLPRDRARLHATAAAWSEALKRTGMMTATAADQEVADGLAGYRLRGRADGRVTGHTVQQWRKQAGQRTPSGIDGDTYRQSVASFGNMRPEVLNQAVPAMLRNLLPHLFTRPA